MTSMQWRTTLAATAVLGALTAGVAQAEPLKDTLAPAWDVLSNKGEGYDLSDSILGADSPYDFGGWVAVGYTSEKTGQFNSHNNLNVTQAWLYFEKAMDTTEGFDWGFRTDLMVGTDAADTQAFGNTPGKWDYDGNASWGKYGFANPQIYGELGYKNVKVKAGHFYTPMGYESVMAPLNFFYSHALTMYFSEAFTHTGVLATYAPMDGLEVYGGWTAGWDTAFDQYSGGNSFLGGFSASPVDWAKITYITTAGDLGWIGRGYAHSLIADTTITEKLNYVFQTDYLNVHEKGADLATVDITNMLFYQVTDKVKVGGRFEWYCNSDTDYYVATAGVNLQLLPNLKVRPEYRYQFSQEVENNPLAASIPIPTDQGAFAFDVILDF